MRSEAGFAVFIVSLGIYAVLAGAAVWCEQTKCYADWRGRGYDVVLPAPR